MLTDYPDFGPGDEYIIAMAGGDGEDGRRPIRDYVLADMRRAEQDGCEIISEEPEDWVDTLYVYRGDCEIAEWTRRDGWKITGWAEVKL